MLWHGVTAGLSVIHHAGSMRKAHFYGVLCGQMGPVIIAVITRHVEVTHEWIQGEIQQGHGVASGKNAETPYPNGTIAMQAPFFKNLGLDLFNFWPGTINISFKPLEVVLSSPDFTFEKMCWTTLHPPETFSFWKVKLCCLDDYVVNGLIYYPHPETKSRHLQAASTLEVLAPWIEHLDYGCPFKIKAAAGSLQLIDGCRLRAKLLEFLKFRVLASPVQFFSDASIDGKRAWLKSTNPEFLALPDHDLNDVWKQAKSLYTET